MPPVRQPVYLECRGKKKRKTPKNPEKETKKNKKKKRGITLNGIESYACPLIYLFLACFGLCGTVLDCRVLYRLRAAQKECGGVIRQVDKQTIKKRKKLNEKRKKEERGTKRGTGDKKTVQ